MKLNYDKETDSLYIHLSEALAVDSDEVKEGIVLDYAEDGSLVGIDIQHASHTTDIAQLVVNHLPVSHFNAA
ncbi:hypothetical protein CK501_11140 [Halovibrio salipaludis]|uniref:DUF2283 domain-containing protein n=1 Tax=Halovibrio salipaludis TaxID=2032626 RepID=A0A2A2F693_9GAMM|nr:DUF2283 domain-containing protein [Halovibrio salipaludis]PAU80187.1 hypothetical protein CK501_11140 [Halovibrio salipaludis]